MGHPEEQRSSTGGGSSSRRPWPLRWSSSLTLAGKTVAFGKENTKRADAALDRALKELVAMDGGPPGVIAIVQRGQHREVHSFGVRNLKGNLPLRAKDRMRIASAAKAFSGAVAL
jgi:D-alanyl-D-alanine carboxypeptidase